jgi:TonB family protein
MVSTINSQGVCPHSSGHTSKVVISGFSGQETQTELEATIGEVLMSPEAFLASYGVPAVPAVDDPREPKRSGARVGIDSPARSLLMVAAGYPTGERLAGAGGVVKIDVTIGRDGKLYDAKVVDGQHSGFEVAAIVVLSLWRYQPVRDGNGQPFATDTTLTTTFFLKP